LEASRGAVTGLGIDMMVARSFARGHLIEYRDGRWVYQDTQGSAETGRFCVRCGLKPTQEGYDACIGFLPDTVSACCGHGVERPFVVKK